MAINSRDVKSLLDEKNITYLYHANTVLTTLTYLRAGGLLSRGAVEDSGLFQTPQTSDKKDKELGIWYDIFFDSVDIHDRAKELNQYGPVTFVFTNDVLINGNLNVKITRDNPVRWEVDTPENERYFATLEQLRTDYYKGCFYQHLTICNMYDVLPFKYYLREIIIDDPKVENEELFSNAYQKIREILSSHYPEVTLLIRKCASDCNCTKQYNSYKPGAIWYKYKTT